MHRLITAGAGLALIAAPLVATTATVGNAATDTAARQAPGFAISAKVNKTTVIGKQDTIKIRGRVRPGAAGEKVVLQQRLEGKKSWAATGSAKVKANGTFLLKDEPTVAGARSYRVVQPATGGLAKSLSNEVDVVVYAWSPLTDRVRGASAGVSSTTATIGAESFADSLVNTTPDAPTFLEYTLGKKCLKVRATYALADSSATGGTGTVALKVDDRVAFATGLVLGQIVEDAETDVTGAFRIRYELASSGAPAATAVVGTPEVLCTK